MSTIASDKLSRQRKLKRTRRAGKLVLTLTVLSIAYFSLLNVQKGFEEYRRLSQETMPVIASLEGLKFSSMRIHASISEFGMISRLESIAKADKDAAMSREQREVEQGFDQFNRTLVHYREFVQHFFPSEVTEAEQLFHEGNLFSRHAKKLLTAIKEGAGSHDLFQLKEAMEQREEYFLSLTTKILQSEAEKVAMRNRLISNAFERQIWVLLLGGLVLIGLSIFQLKLGKRVCRTCPGELYGPRQGNPEKQAFPEL